MARYARITLTGTDPDELQKVVDEIGQIAERTDAEVGAIVPLPTETLEVPIRKSPDGEGTATWEHWELRVHKRLLDMESDERALRGLMRIQVPRGVNIEMVLES